jgi:hypothetical protein
VAAKHALERAALLPLLALASLKRYAVGTSRDGGGSSNDSGDGGDGGAVTRRDLQLFDRWLRAAARELRGEAGQALAPEAAAFLQRTQAGVAAELACVARCSAALLTATDGAGTAARVRQLLVELEDALVG